MNQTIGVVALGGLGEVGMNCLLLEASGRIVVIDCGVTFPDREPGIDVIHPDFSYLRERSADVEAIVLTHGHEDHIGALPYLLRDLDVPIHGPPYALQLVERRLAEHALARPPRLIPTEPRRRFDMGPFCVTPYRVTHSIPDSTGLIFETPFGTVVHSGDFKIESDPLDGQHFDSELLAEVGQQGVRLLLSDSTNSEMPGQAGDERGVVDALDQRLSKARGRVVVCMFASNAARLDAVLGLAHKHGRHVLLLGRSLHTHFGVAQALSMAPHAPAALLSEEAFGTVDRERVLVIATGSQAEPGAALQRLARGNHPRVTLQEGDEVVLSSRVIPGRERQVVEMVDALERAGVRVWTRRDDPALHVSGHAHRGEQQRLIELLRPAAFVPVHGTLLHLKRHAALARELGVADTLVVENGTQAELGPAGLRVAGRVATGRVHIQAGHPVSQDVLLMRNKLAERGLLAISVALDPGGRPYGLPDIDLLGLLDEQRAAALQLVPALQRAVLRALEKAKAAGPERQKAALAREAARVFRDATGQRPLIHSVLIRSES